jgi:hypothetical protein
MKECGKMCKCALFQERGASSEERRKNFHTEEQLRMKMCGSSTLLFYFMGFRNERESTELIKS